MNPVNLLAMNPHGVMAVAGLTTALAAAVGGYLARGSTAVPAAAWAIVGALALAIEAAATGAGWLVEPGSRAAARLVVTSLSICPAMSILGAKRPQHGVWQFIVATLACVLSMPAATAMLVRPGSMPDLHQIERCFLPALVVIGWLNYVATRRAVAASFMAAGQFMLMWSILPVEGHGAPLSAGLEALAAGFVAGGAVLAVAQAVCWPLRGRKATGLPGTINPVFLSLRETLGAAWTLRITERFNGVAFERGWPFRLRFSGLALDSEVGDARQAEDAKRCLRSLLRRFVSHAWIGRHGGI